MKTWNLFCQKLHNLAFKTVSVISIALFSILSLSTLLVSFYAEEMDSQIMYSHFDPLWIHIPVIAVILVGIIFVQTGEDTFLRKLRRVLLPLSIGVLLCGGGLLLVFGRLTPAADSYSVYAIGEAFAEGNLAAIQPTGNTYLSFYPQQIGLIAYYELVIRLWKLLPISTPAYHVIKLLNILLACGILYFQYRSVAVITASEKATVTYLLLAMGNLPLIFYTSFVYGEIPSFAFFSMGLYFLLAYIFRAEKSRYLILSAFSFMLSVMLRKNTLILIIAVLLAIFFHWLKTRKHSLAIYGVIVAVLSVCVLPTVQKGYELRADNYLLPGVSAYSYFAMGMQESTRGNGWYNGFNFNTYLETGLDKELTDTISKEIISMRMEEFAENPGYAFIFYRDKLLSQWTDGSYACRQAIVSAFGNRSGLSASLFDGTLGKVFTEYCNIYQCLIYICVLIFLIRNRHLGKLPLYIGIIGIIGGFLFHLIWEANSRYILAYWLLMIPYAAMFLSPIHTSKELRE